MNTGPVLAFPTSTDSQVEAAPVRAGVAVPLPGSGADSSGEIAQPQKTPAMIASPQDEVKMQWEPPGETAVYQFVNQNGSLILQVPSEQMLNLARQITAELAQEAVPKQSSGSHGGQNNAR